MVLPGGLCLLIGFWRKHRHNDRHFTGELNAVLLLFFVLFKLFRFMMFMMYLIIFLNYSFIQKLLPLQPK